MDWLAYDLGSQSVRHAVVYDDGIEILGCDLPPPFGHIGGFPDFVPGIDEVGGYDPAHVSFVFDDENGCHNQVCFPASA